MQIITLTTDFGASDWFVGTLKGVIAGFAPRASVIDLTHNVPPGDIRAGAFSLAASYGFFPKGAVHLAVVDPGVGSTRKAVAVKTRNYFFVGPDNGLLSWAMRNEKVVAIHALEEKRYFRHPISRTFHGRDVFAPVAAFLARTRNIGKLGPALKDIVRLPWPEPEVRDSEVKGEAVYFDRFGNAITNIENRHLQSLNTRSPRVAIAGKIACPLLACYTAVPAGKLVAVPGSTGFLEIALNGGNAERKLKLRIGSPVRVLANIRPGPRKRR